MMNSTSIHERVSVVTGGTQGIGRAVALRLARGGDRVIVVGRDLVRGPEVVAALRAARPGADHAFIAADLSLMAETARVADEIAARTARLDAIVCCAGILSTIPAWTAEQIERNLALNYLTRYLLVRRLLPSLIAAPSGRVVLVSNAGMYGDTLDFDDLHHRRGKRGLRVAGRTQFANDLFATELADRVRDTRVQVACMFPGMVRTDVFRNAQGLPWLLRTVLGAVQRLRGLTPDAAAETPVFLAQSAEATDTASTFWGPRRTRRKIPARARRADRRAALWAASEALVGAHLAQPAAPVRAGRAR
jgi:NAD(P)-dependent dehydrogenase (short-subunit alcohol dehydrogenase family)